MDRIKEIDSFEKVFLEKEFHPKEFKAHFLFMVPQCEAALNVYKNLAPGFSYLICTSKNLSFKGSYIYSDYSKLWESLLIRIEEDKNFIDNYSADFQKESLKLNVLCSEIKQNPEFNIKIFEELVNQIVKTQSYGYLSEIFVETKFLKKIFKEHYEVLSKPIFESFLSRFQKKLLENKEQAMKEFYWINGSYYNLPTKIKLTEIKFNNLSNSSKKEILHKNPSLEIYSNLVDVFGKIQDVRKENLLKSLYALDFLMTGLSGNTNVSKEILLELFPDEVIDFVKTRNLPPINKRLNQCSIIFSKQGYFFSEDEEIYSKINSLFQFDDVHFVKGTVACKGKVIGTAKIIMDETQFSKFNEGEILITSMTRPEFVPLMQKASAFVTNEGGITSHAAIVSREMNKPCIIGTKIASNIFKDGDLIEVDANKGIVKKLN